jgi:AcrR family transcriptional regulator
MATPLPIIPASTKAWQVNTVVYGREMSNRLTRSDWISHGLRTLASEGPGALKVGPMAAKLKVSRGSFYWHFQDLTDFEAQLLRSWEETSTDSVIRDLDDREGEPTLLRHFMGEAFRGRRKLDRAMRAWAAEDRSVAQVVAAVDARRIHRVAKMLVDLGVDSERALHRATFLYWAFLGQAVVMNPAGASLPVSAMDDLIGLFET